MPRLVNKIITNLIRLILVLTIILTINQNRILIQTIATLALLATFIPVTLQKLFHVKIPSSFEIINLMAIYGLLLFGELRGYFSGQIWWSVLISFTASLVLGFTGLTLVHVLIKTKRINSNKTLAAILIFTFTLSLATLWELFEFSLDLILSTGLQKSLLDTMQDLVVNAIGATLITIAGHKTLQSKNPIFTSNFLTKALEKNSSILGPKLSPKSPQKIIQEILKVGETSKIEFKSTLRKNLHTRSLDKKIETAVLKTITAFLNTSGGNLLIGVDDNKNILGLENDDFTSDDRIRLHLTNLIKNQIGNEFVPFIKTQLIKQAERFSLSNKQLASGETNKQDSEPSRTILLVSCSPSPKPVFLKVEDREEFYIRNGPSSGKLEGSSLINYINNRLKEQ